MCAYRLRCALTDCVVHLQIAMCTYRYRFLSGDREPRSLFLAHFGLNQWRSALSLAEVEEVGICVVTMICSAHTHTHIHTQTLFRLGCNDCRRFVPLLSVFFELCLQLYERERSLPHFSNENWCPLLRRVGRYSEAVLCAQRAAEENPDSDVAESVWGGVLGDMHDHGKALEHHAKQVARNPKHEQSHNGLGCALHFLENFAAAVPHYEEQLRCNPLNMHSHRNLALALEQLGRKQEALDMFEYEVKMYPDFRVAHRSYHLLLAELCKGDLSRALSVYDELEKQFCDKAYFDTLRAAVYLEMKDLDKALSLLCEVVRINCWDDYALGLLAEVLVEKARGDDAVKMMELIVHWTPQHGVAWEALGRMLRRVGRHQEGIQAFTRQLPYYIERYALYNSIAECHLELKQYDEVNAEAVVMIFRSFFSSQRSILLVITASAFLKPGSQSIAAARISIEINPVNVLALGAWGAALTAQAKYDEAIEVYRKQIALDTRRVAFGLYNIGLCYQRLGRHDESLRYFREHLNHNADDVLAMLQIGTQYWYLQDYHQSVAMYKEALALEPTHPQCAFFIADTLATMGRHEEALKFFELHERNAPQDLNAHMSWAESISTVSEHLVEENNSNRAAGLAIDPAQQSRLDVLQCQWTHHMQRSLGVLKECAMPDQGYRPVALTRPCNARFRSGFVFLLEEPCWLDGRPWTPTDHLSMGSHSFVQQTKALLLIVLRFARQQQRSFPKVIF
jgi:tetratricopeptide (TPR) repeat protein